VKITIYGWNTNLSISGGAVAAVWARQWRRDPVMVLRALATLTRMARDNCAGGEARGRRVEQSAWVLLWLVRADYPLVSRPGVRGELTAFVAASHLARSVTRSKGRRWREE
jgi:hypothetical protein